MNEPIRLPASDPTPAPGPRSLSFEQLIAPVSPSAFVEDHWEKAPLFVSRHDPGYYGSVFTLEDVDRYLHAARHTGREVSIVPPVSRQQKSERHLIGSVPLDRLYGAFATGETIRLEAIQLSWPPVAALVADMAGALAAEANVNLYMTPANSQGLPLHFDTHDVFVVQVDGAKDWYVYEPEVELPVETRSYLEHLGAVGQTGVVTGSPRLIERRTLHTGDLLYMPRGFPHKAITGDRHSVHLALAMKTRNWIDLVKTAVELLCIDRPEFRRALPPGFMDDPEIREGMRRSFAQMMQACAEETSFDAALAAVMRYEVMSRSYPPDGHFGQLARLDGLRSGDTVRRRAGLRCIAGVDGDGCSIDFATNRVRGPLAILPALEYVRDHEQFRVAELPDSLSEHSKCVLVRRLIREGLLVRLSSSP